MKNYKIVNEMREAKKILESLGINNKVCVTCKKSLTGEDSIWNGNCKDCGVKWMVEHDIYDVINLK